MERGTATAATTPASRMVFHMRGASISEMGVPMVPKPLPALETPRSPVIRFPSQKK